jgi:hypothetical protein
MRDRESGDEASVGREGWVSTVIQRGGRRGERGMRIEKVGMKQMWEEREGSQQSFREGGRWGKRGTRDRESGDEANVGREGEVSTVIQKGSRGERGRGNEESQNRVSVGRRIA